MMKTTSDLINLMVNLFLLPLLRSLRNPTHSDFLVSLLGREGITKPVRATTAASSVALEAVWSENLPVLYRPILALLCLLLLHPPPRPQIPLPPCRLRPKRRRSTSGLHRSFLPGLLLPRQLLPPRARNQAALPKMLVLE